MSEKRKVVFLTLILIAVIAVGAAAYRFLGSGAGTQLVETAPSGETPSSSSSASQEEEPKTVAAPDCTLYDVQGEQILLSEILNGPAVLNFWASTCPPCRQEMPDFQAAYESYGDQIQFIMIDGVGSMLNETQEAGAAYIEEQGFTFPVYFDNDRDAVTQYGISAFPTTYLVDSDGMVIAGAQGMLTAESLENGLQMLLEE